MPPFALEIAGVSKRYGERAVLSHVDLVARASEIHGLLGPNGAGKTTLMRIVLGLAARDAGRIRIFGQDLDSIRGPLPAGVAGFAERPAFYPYLSGRRNLLMLARLDGSLPSRRSRAVNDALEQVDLLTHADLDVAAYSSGMRQRLGLAAALLRSPRLLLLDEPTSSLDPAAACDVRTLVRRMAATGTAVVFSSHDMTEVEELCAAVTIVNHGRVVFSGLIDELRRLAPIVHVLRTSDDAAALDLAWRHPVIRVAASADHLAVSGETADIDAFVIALGRASIAVRYLEQHARSLESLFLLLTGLPDRNMPAMPAFESGVAALQVVS